MVTILTNMVLQYIKDGDTYSDKRIRIIWIDRSYKYASFVSIDKYGSMPELIDINKLEQQISDGNLKEIKDPYDVYINEDEISEEHKIIRDKRWEVVEYLWKGDEPEILFKKYRGKCIKDTSQVLKVPEITIRKIIKIFWQCGINKNALLPDYNNCGGKGVIREPSEKKRGRPRKISAIEETVLGINVDKDILAIILISIKTYYRKSQKKTKRDVYELMLQHHFSDKYYINGEERYKVWGKNRRITYETFLYYFRKFEDPKKDKISRYGEINYLLNDRELLRNSTSEVFGPGAVYQIDATIGDIYLVSTINRDRIIGRPVIYEVIDVFSRLITGLYVGLEGPSWIGAMMALDNVVEDKVELCDRYGISISQDIWSSSLLPEKILADRGEFEGYNAEGLINNLGVKVENTPPFRGDLKGIIERYFRTTNERIKHMTPGAIQKEFRDRIDRDYRLDATLDLMQFTRIIINMVLDHNQSTINGYVKERGMLKDEIPPFPIEIWNWGIKNRKCGFINKDRDIIRLNLLYKRTASITREGIKLKKDLFYSCDEAIEQQWFIGDRKKIDILFDPRKMRYIYIPQNNGNSHIRCNMLDKCGVYKDLDYEEIVFQEELNAEIIESKTDEIIENKININAEIQKIIKEAEEQKQESDESNRQRTKNIRENRAKEKEIIREKESFELGKSDEKSIQTDSHCDDTNITNGRDFLDLLKERRDSANGKV